MAKFSAAAASSYAKRKKVKNAEHSSSLENRPSHFNSIDENLYKTKLAKFMDKVEPFVLTLIIVNAIMMGIGTFDFVTENDQVEDVFEKIDMTFLIVFTIELFFNLIVYFNLDRLEISPAGIRYKFTSPLARQLNAQERKSKQDWLAFDAFIVFTSWAFSDLSVFRGFRILRALRLVTRLQMFRKIIQSLMYVSKKVRYYHHSCFESM